MSSPTRSRIALDVINLVVLVAFAINSSPWKLAAHATATAVRAAGVDKPAHRAVPSDGAPARPGRDRRASCPPSDQSAALPRRPDATDLRRRRGPRRTDGDSPPPRSTRFTLSLAALTWLTSAVAFTLAEDVGRTAECTRSAIIWWSISTITTVGYGDIFTPVTFAGRLIGAFTMLVGISTFAVVTAKVAEFLVQRTRKGDPARDETKMSQARGSSAPRYPRGRGPFPGQRAPRPRLA